MIWRMPEPERLVVVNTTPIIAGPRQSVATLRRLYTAVTIPLLCRLRYALADPVALVSENWRLIDSRGAATGPTAS
jgi:hypothetical protein